MGLTPFVKKQGGGLGLGFNIHQVCVIYQYNNNLKKKIHKLQK